jgi:dephospho-CoA kinase
MVVMVLTGKRGCGKDTFAELMKEKYGFMTLDFSRDSINPVLEERGLPITRDNLINTAMDMRSKDGTDVFARILCEKIHTDRNYCISGMRFAEEFECMKKKFGKSLILVAIMCSPALRHERIKLRGDKGEGNMTFSDFMKVDERPTEKAIDELIGLADFFIDNNSTKTEFEKSIKAFAKEVKI